MSNVKSYFDYHSHHDAYHKEAEFYRALYALIPRKPSPKILDVGCGDGSFIKEIISSGINADFVGIDFSQSMLLRAKENLKHTQVGLLLCDGFQMPLRDDQKFDVVHIDSVLHHLIAKTKGQSMNLVERMVAILMGRLSNDGILVVEEVFFNSHLFPSFTSVLIFYGLKLLNALHFDANKLLSDIHLGLEVNFLTEGQLYEIIGSHTDEMKIVRKVLKDQKRFKRIFLVKESGDISLVARRATK